MKLIKRSKKQNTKKTKIVEKKSIKSIVTLKKHDVIFDIVHLKMLLYGDNFMQTVPNYINNFFFKYGSKIFFDNGKCYECLTIEEAKRKIPEEYSRSFTVRTGERTRQKK